MSTRIVKTEKFNPAIGNPVFQVTDETTLPSGQVMRLDPRNPSPEELQEANESFAASQQILIATLQTEKTTLLSEKATLEAEKATLETEGAEVCGHTLLPFESV